MAYVCWKRIYDYWAGDSLSGGWVKGDPPTYHAGPVLGYGAVADVPGVYVVEGGSREMVWLELESVRYMPCAVVDQDTGAVLVRARDYEPSEGA